MLYQTEENNYIRTSTGLRLLPTQENLQIAIIDVGKADGGDIWLSGGDINIKDENLLIYNDSIKIHGAGFPFRTTLKFDNCILTNFNCVYPYDELPFEILDNCVFENFDFTGIGGGIYLHLGDNNRLEDIIAHDTGGFTGAMCFIVDGGTTMSNLKVYNCHCRNTWGSGFNIMGFYPGDSTVVNPHFKDCTAKWCGNNSLNWGYHQDTNWSAGFCFCEQHWTQPKYDPENYRLYLHDLLVENCLAEYCWESGFHFEWIPRKYNCTFKDCISRNNGRKAWAHPEWVEKNMEVYSSGWLGTMDCTFINCEAHNNGRDGFLCSGSHQDGNRGTFENCKSYDNQFEDCEYCVWDCE